MLNTLTSHGLGQIFYNYVRNKMLCTAESVDAFIKYIEDSLGKAKVTNLDYTEKKKPPIIDKNEISKPKWIIRYCAKERKWIKEPPTVYTGPAMYQKDENCTG